MRTDQTAPNNIDEYIASFPHDVQEILEKIRLTIRKAAPDAKETIEYQMPTFTLKGDLVFFAAFRRHIGFYPRATGNEQFKRELSPIPFDLIGKIVEYRVKENLESAEARGRKK